MEERAEKKSDVDLLFPDEEIYGVKVRPWTYDQFISILPSLSRTQKALRELGIGVEKIMGLDETDKEGLIELLVQIAPVIPTKEMVSKSVNVDLAEVGSWEFDKTICIFLLVMIQNVSRIKNFFGLGPTLLRRMKKVS